MDLSVGLNCLYSWLSTKHVELTNQLRLFFCLVPYMEPYVRSCNIFEAVIVF